MAYSLESIWQTTQQIHNKLRKDPAFKYTRGSPGIWIPEVTTITEPLHELQTQVISHEMATAIHAMLTILNFSGADNGLFISTNESNQAIDLEIHGQPGEDENNEDGLQTQSNRVSVIIGNRYVYMGVDSDVLGIYACEQINTSIKNRPLSEKVYTAGRIVDIVAEAVQRASR